MVTFFEHCTGKDAAYSVVPVWLCDLFAHKHSLDILDMLFKAASSPLPCAVNQLQLN